MPDLKTKPEKGQLGSGVILVASHVLLLHIGKVFMRPAPFGLTYSEWACEPTVLALLDRLLLLSNSY